VRLEVEQDDGLITTSDFEGEDRPSWESGLKIG
jgi:hypothetical protein